MSDFPPPLMNQQLLIILYQFLYTMNASAALSSLLPPPSPPPLSLSLSMSKTKQQVLFMTQTHTKEKLSC